MTTKELSQLYYLKKEIEMDNQRLCKLKLLGDPLATECEKIIQVKVQKCNEERVMLEQYIATVPNSVVRQILTYRFIDNFSWQRIALKIGGNNTADGVRQICKRYIKNN